MTKGININKFIATIPAVVRFVIQSQKNLNSSPETQQNTTETPKSSKTKLGLAALAMSTIVSGTQAQASDLLAQCDYNQNGIIDGRTYLKDLKKELKKDGDYSDEDKQVYKVALINAKKERRCKTEIIKNRIAEKEDRIAEKEDRIAEKKIYLAQLDMNIENLKKELKKAEEELGGKEKELEKKIKVLKDLISKAAQQLLKYK